MNGKINKAFKRFQADEILVQRTFDNIVNGKKKRLSLGYKLAPIMLICTVMILFGVYFTPVAYISIDINPSIELSLNRFEIVMQARATNADGQKILNSLNLNNLNYIEAIETLYAADAFANYTDSYTEITVISNSGKNSENMIATINNSNFSGENIYCHAGNNSLKNEAEHHNMSFGKYRACAELLEVDDSLTIDEIDHLSLAEIRKLIEEHHPEAETINNNQHQGNNQHHGNGGGNRHNQ